ncbi:MAG TPA: GSCFA domain-containing protein [Cyclobacteriaceae bacterium]
MDRFRTELPVIPKPMIRHGSSIVTTGSCFSDNIGQKLAENKLDVVVNPLGTCYNPLSIHKGLLMTEPDDDLFVETNRMWRHFDFHSKFFADTKERLRELLVLRLQVPKTDIVIITYGTSWVYKHRATGKIVANCHKRPQSEFEKILLTPEQVVASFEELQASMKQEVIVTLSPVRHVKDTLELNSVSKSILRHAIYNFRDVEYFPAYEIMMDDLRDYRFYESDLIHPSNVAIDYIWDKFGERYFSRETKELNERWQKVLRSLNHKGFNTGSAEYKKFLEGVLKELKVLSTELDVVKEIHEVEHRIT